MTEGIARLHGQGAASRVSRLAYSVLLASAQPASYFRTWQRNHLTVLDLVCEDGHFGVTGFLLLRL